MQRAASAEYALALDMLRLAPSASNKQPWRVVRDGDRWHFYCQRTPGYGRGGPVFSVLKLADLQRLDVGIAMCHFEQTLLAQGVQGKWEVAAPQLTPDDAQILYVASFRSG